MAVQKQRKIRFFTPWVRYIRVLLEMCIALLNCLSNFFFKFIHNRQRWEKNKWMSFALQGSFSHHFRHRGTLGAGYEAVMPGHFPLTSEHLFDIGCKFFCPEVIQKILFFTTAPLHISFKRIARKKAIL